MFWDSEETTDNHAANTVTVTNAIKLNHPEVIYVLYIIAFCVVVDIVLKIYNSFHRKMKSLVKNERKFDVEAQAIRL